MLLKLSLKIFRMKLKMDYFYTLQPVSLSLKRNAVKVLLEKDLQYPTAGCFGGISIINNFDIGSRTSQNVDKAI